MSIAQTSQLLQLVLNSAVMMVIALMWWGVAVFRLNLVSNDMQRLRRQYRRTRAEDGHTHLLLRLRQHRHDLMVRHRLSRHSVLIMHYVLLSLMGSLFLLALRALVNTNLLITAALFLFVLGAAGILLSVALALMEFYQLNALMVHGPAWADYSPSPSAMGTVVPQYQVAPQTQAYPLPRASQNNDQGQGGNRSMGAMAS